MGCSIYIYRHFGRTPGTGDQPDARPVPTQDNTTQKHTDTHPCLKQDSNLRFQRSSGRRQYPHLQLSLSILKDFIEMIDMYTVSFVMCFQRNYGITKWYSAGLRAGWSGFRVPVGARNSPLHHHVQTDAGAYPASYPVGTRSYNSGYSSRGVKLTTYFHLEPRSRMHGAIPPLPQYAFMPWCLVEAQGQLYPLPLINLYENRTVTHFLSYSSLFPANNECYKLRRSTFRLS
jgi:hypothetical protein